MENKRKKYVTITESTTSDEIFAILDDVGGDYESDIDNTMNDSDTEYIVEGKEPLVCVETTSGDSSLLIPEANIHYVDEEQFSSIESMSCDNNNIHFNILPSLGTSSSNSSLLIPEANKEERKNISTLPTKRARLQNSDKIKGSKKATSNNSSVLITDANKGKGKTTKKQDSDKIKWSKKSPN